MSDPPTKRFIDRLSADQLKRKREIDRNSQRQARERQKAQVNFLELRVLQLEQEKQELQQRLAACRCHDVAAVQTPPLLMLPPAPLGHANWENRDLGIDLAQLIGEEQLDQTTVLQDIVNSSSQEAPTTLYLKYDFIPSTEALPNTAAMWSRLPVHTSPLCPLDQVVADLVQARRPYELSGGNIQEFQKRPFPSVQSLLNSENETETEKSPVTTLIVNKIINIMTVPTLPEQLAILWFMGSVIRWLISPTEANYNSMPEWLRPTPAQLECPHPIWMDLFLWPKAREKMCRSPEYHDKIDIMSGVSNESISINWPYQLSDMVMQVNGLGSEIVLTPAFERHMKDLKNWSVGPRMFEVFPGLADTGINIRSTGGVPGWSW